MILKMSYYSMKFSVLSLLILVGLFFSSNIYAQVMSSAAIGAFVKQQFSTGNVQINKVVLEQPHIIPKESIDKFFTKYEGKEISVEDVKEIQKRLSKYYYAKGYINSGVIVPNQKIENGILKFRAVHGRLTRVKAKGNKRISNAYIKNAVAKGVTVPLNSEKLQLALEALQKHPLISEVKANISPGEKLGESILELKISEEKPYFLSAEMSNHQSPSIGQYRIGMSFGHRDVTGLRDTLKIDLSKSEGLTSGNVDYTLPLTLNDYMFNAYINYGKFSIIDEEFSAAEIDSESTTFGFSVNAPLYKTSHAEISGGIGLDIKHMTLSMFGEPATLSEGFVDGESNSTPMVFHVNALYQERRFVAAMYAGIRRGTNISLFGGSDEDRVFTVGVSQLSMALKLIPKLEWNVRINGQLTGDNLLPAEKFAIGGVKSVRGYRENLLVRDNGLVISNQLRYSIFRSKLFLVPFVDYGRSWDSEQGTLGASGEQIYSAGAGLQWKANKALYTELFWGKTLTDVATNSDQTQDYSFHVLMRYTFY